MSDLPNIIPLTTLVEHASHELQHAVDDIQDSQRHFKFEKLSLLFFDSLVLISIPPGNNTTVVSHHFRSQVGGIHVSAFGAL